MDKGLVHLYYGEGKGKTTAAMGLALRALGHGKRVVIVQFLKDGASGEIGALRSLGAKILTGAPDTKFVFRMNAEEKDRTRSWNDALLEEAVREDCDLLVLDELCAARQYGLADRTLAQKAVLERPAGREVVITGRTPEEWMLEAADYVTQMRCEKHPYAAGITARKGIEY